MGLNQPNIVDLGEHRRKKGDVQPESQSKRFIQSVKYEVNTSPSGRELPNTYYDRGKEGHPNLQLRVYPNSKTWYFQKKHSGRVHRTKIGDALSIPIQIARDECKT